MCKEIGGYFSLELNNGKPYHKDAIELNTARNAFEYILRAYKYSKVFLPYYTCEVMLEPLEKLHIPYEFYHIDEYFKPTLNKELDSNEGFVYTNYWGICDSTVKSLREKYQNLIVDNSQAFYSKPLENTPTFYSARKFFGVSDGAYLYCDKKLDTVLEQDISWYRMTHLLKRLDLSANEGYEDFKANDNSLINQPIKTMSKLTKAILSSIDYTSIAEKRRDNFEFLHSKLKEINELKFDLDNTSVPMVYPFLFKSGTLKQELINNKIYVATYWPMVKEKAPHNSLEQYLYNYMIPLTIDQRYNFNSIKSIIKTVEHNI